MGNRSGREALRGAEAQILDLISQVLTSEQWAELLKMPLESAAGQGNRDLAQKLMEAGAEIGDAMHKAVQGGHGEVVKVLLHNGASINANHSEGDGTPLHVAAEEGSEEMVQLLMLQGADKDSLDNADRTPLSIAACRGHATASVALMTAGADVNIRYGEYKRSVVHIAVEQGHADILRAAIEHGADVDAVDTRRVTALYLAAERDRVEAIDLLLEAGANIEARNIGGLTPLHIAAGLHRIGAVAALLKHGAHVNARADALVTPLHCAALMAGSPELADATQVVDILLRSGADETIVASTYNVTAMDSLAAGEGEEIRLAEDVERVRKLLANAPADRAWRRRGYLVLCRAHPDRLRQAGESSSTGARPARDTPHAAKLRRTEASRCDQRGGGSTGDEPIDDDWVGVVKRVVDLQEDGVFRTIVGYL